MPPPIRTKIVCTLGSRDPADPALPQNAPDFVERLAAAGMSVARLNLSHNRSWSEARGGKGGDGFAREDGWLDAIDRVNAYLEAGADVGFVEAPQTIEELRIVGQRVRGPALVNVFEGGKTPMLNARELATMGFRLGIYPSQTHRAAIRAAQRVLSALKEDGDAHRVEADLATFQEREEAVGTERWRELEEKYLRIPDAK